MILKKQIFSNCTLEIICFSVSDVITTSGADSFSGEWNEFDIENGLN